MDFLSRLLGAIKQPFQQGGIGPELSGGPGFAPPDMDAIKRQALGKNSVHTPLGDWQRNPAMMDPSPKSAVMPGINAQALMSAVTGNDPKFGTPLPQPVTQPKPFTDPKFGTSLRGPLPQPIQPTGMPVSMPEGPTGGTPALQAGPIRIYDKPDEGFAPPPNAKTGKPVRAFTEDPMEGALKYREDLESWEPKDQNGRFKSILLGALMGGLQGLATGGDLQSALAGAATRGAIGGFAPQLDELEQKQYEIGQADATLKRIQDSIKARQDMESGRADIEYKRANTKKIESEPIEREKDRNLTRTEGDKNRATSIYGQEAGLIKNTQTNQTSRANAELRAKTQKEIAQMRDATQKQIAADKNKLSQAQFAAKYPGAGKRLTMSQIEQRAKEKNMYPEDVLQSAVRQGYEIDFEK